MSSGPLVPAFIHQLFETQADRRPTSCAIVCGSRSLSYADVEQQANRLAHLLRQYGAGPGRFVAIHLERSERAIVAILAILKSGAAYVPIDPVYPAERIRHILQDASVVAIVSEAALAEAARSWASAAEVIALDDAATAARVKTASSARLDAGETGAAPSDLCYVMYTSGTTGRPKGIMAEHRHVVAFTAAFQAVCGIHTSDRIYQGFSLGFDGSVEEYVLAFAGGAPLVVGPPALAHDGGATAAYLTAHGVTYFSTVPTFLRLIPCDVPSLRLIVVSGEPCPPDLVTRWTGPERRMLNVYGPTETTVNATSWECDPTQPVSIGRPLDGYRTYILDPEGRRVVSGPGELFVGGVGVSRGYLNQPDLTADAFLPDPFAGRDGARMYRTGDLVELDDAGALRFLGRRDSQVKIRGFRIELDEIECVLREHPGVDAAAVSVVDRDGQVSLAAHLVARDLDRGKLLAHLRARLPPYMMPAFVDTVDALPRLASGKLDRRSLPPPVHRLVEAGRPIVAARTGRETQLVALWETLFHTSPISIDDDFFLDLGGDSLLATSFVNAVQQTLHVDVSLRQVYVHPTIARLAALIDVPTLDAPPDHGRASRPSSRDVFASTPVFIRGLAVTLQTLGAVVLYGLAATMPFAMFVIVRSMVHGTRSFANGASLLTGMSIVAYPLWIGLTILLKWLVVGRYRPGRHAIHGLGYVRYWFARRIQLTSGVGLLAGTPLMNVYYRLMGARVGRDCIIDTSTCAAFDLVSIGDESAIGAGTHLLGYRIVEGVLEFGPIDIGARCFVGIHSVLDTATRIEDDGRLGDQSLLPRGATISAGESWRGSPATPGPVPVVAARTDGAVSETPLRGTGIVFGCLALLLDVTVLVALVPAALLVWALRDRAGLVVAAALVAAVPISVVSLCAVFAALKALMLRRLEPGVYPVKSWLYGRKWFVDGLVGLSRTFLHPLYTTIYLPPWLRLMGARVGRLAEISTIGEGAPDLFDIGAQSFFADGSMIGGRRFYRGHLQIDVSRVGARSFVGNSAILPVGSHLGAGCLLGVLSSPPDSVDTTPDRTEWLGSPSFRLPHRRRVEGFDAGVTYEPTRRLFAHRLLVDGVRILVPGLIVLGTSVVAYVLTAAARAHLSLPWTLVLLPAAAFLLAMLTALAVVVLKVVVMGRFEPVIKPLWCPYVWWNEVVNGAWETVAAPVLSPIVGSPLFNVVLRLMGCRVGHAARVETTLFSEFDLVDIGHHAVLGEGAVIQNHLFEDRIMKSSRVIVGDSASVGSMSIVLYDSELGAGCVLEPLSLVMKGSVVPPGARWVGIPASPATTAAGVR